MLQYWSLLDWSGETMLPARSHQHVVVDGWRTVDRPQVLGLFFHHPWAEKISRGNSCGPLPASRVPVGRYVLERKSDPEPCAGD